MNFRFSRSYIRELKGEIRLFLIMAVAFSISFAWRQTMFDATLGAIHFLFNIQGELASSVAASLLITVIGAILLLVFAKFLQEPY